MSVIFWLKLSGLALLIMIINIATSILEVFAYSLLVPGQPESFYSAHAQLSAPWVATIGGAVWMFVFTRQFIIKNEMHRLMYAVALPSVYLAMDLIIMYATVPDFLNEPGWVIAATTARYTGSLMAYLISDRAAVAQQQ